ncbi:MAG: glycosyltransferase family 4 protein [Chitinophagaceae bacterium]|nr:glycosyltransferase family 4 protein [Chitinophagaceae bacterium]
MRKKILFITRWYPNRVDKLDGNFIENHARAVSMFADLAVLYVGADPTMSDKSYACDVSTEHGFTVVRVWYRNNDVSTKINGRIIKFFRYLKATNIGWRQTKKLFGLPDVNHVHIFTRPVLLAFYLRFRYRIPFLITEHSSHFVHDLPVLLPPMKWFAQYAARQARIITAVSKTLQEAMNAFGLHGNYRIVPNVVFVNEIPSEKKQEITVVNIIAIGGLTDQRKNIAGLIQTFAAIHMQLPDARLNIVRPVSDQKLYELAKETGLLKTKIFFHDYLSNDEVYALLADCAFLVVNSISETFSMAAAEALACGKPVITTRCGGPEEFIDEQTGVLIDVDAPDQLSAALISMYEKYNEFRPEKLKQYATDHFSAQIVGKKFMDIYDQLAPQTRH